MTATLTQVEILRLEGILARCIGVDTSQYIEALQDEAVGQTAGAAEDVYDRNVFHKDISTRCDYRI